MYAAIRLRGRINVNRELSDTMDMLRLKQVNNCSILPKNPTAEGMLKKAANFVTWGEVSEDVLAKLLHKRGRLDEKQAKELAKKILKDGVKELKERVFRLSPASKGLKSIKARFPKGDLGYRGKKINQLLERML